MAQPNPIQDRRKPPRYQGNVAFKFGENDAMMTTSSIDARDASIRSARFSLDFHEQIKRFSAGIIEFPNTNLAFESMKIPPEHIRENQKTFVVTYKTRQLEIGRQLRGTHAGYQIADFIGVGQSAETYKAHVIAAEAGSSLDRVDSVLIKVPLFIPYLADKELVKLASSIDDLFSDEESSLKRLKGLTCVPIFLDTGVYHFPRTEAAATKFIVQSFVEGQPLEFYLLDKWKDPNGRFPGLQSNSFYKLAAQLADAVQQVHWRMIIHGDIWPDNILIRKNGEPVLIDFGQATFREAASSIVKVSGRNIRYIAPEGKRTVSGDLYSLGGVLFYLATGEDPPQIPSDIRADVEALSDLIRGLIRAKNNDLLKEAHGTPEIIARCLCMNDQRYGDVHTLIERLDTFFLKPDKTAKKVTEAAKDLIDKSDSLEKNGATFFSLMANLRVHALRADLMVKGVYDLVIGENLIAAAMTQYLSLLDKGDEYLTMSTPRFCRPGNPGSNGEFRAINVIAAQRGSIIKRLIIIGPEDPNSKYFLKAMYNHMQLLREVEALEPAGSYEVKILYAPELNSGNALYSEHHFGLLIRKGDKVAVYPEYRKDETIAAARFRAGDNLVGNVRGTFNLYWNHSRAIDIRNWPNEEDIRVRAYEKHIASAGSPHSPEEDWIQAEKELISERFLIPLNLWKAS